MPRERGIWAAPLEETGGRRWDSLIDAWPAIVGSSLIHRLAAETKNPRFNAPFWDEVSDPVAGGSSSPITELLLASGDGAVVGVDGYYKSRHNASGPGAVRLDCLRVTIENPLRARSPSSAQRREANIVARVPAAVKVPANKRLLTLILNKDNCPGGPTHSPSPARPVRQVPGRNRIRSGSPALEPARSRRGRIARPHSLPTD